MEARFWTTLSSNHARGALYWAITKDQRYGVTPPVRVALHPLPGAGTRPPHFPFLPFLSLPFLP